MVQLNRYIRCFSTCTFLCLKSSYHTSSRCLWRSCTFDNNNTSSGRLLVCKFYILNLLDQKLFSVAYLCVGPCSCQISHAEIKKQKYQSKLIRLLSLQRSQLLRLSLKAAVFFCIRGQASWILLRACLLLCAQITCEEASLQLLGILLD